MALKEDEIAKIVNKAMKELRGVLKELDKVCDKADLKRVETISSTGQYDLYDLQEDEERLRAIFSKETNSGKTPEYYANRSYDIRVFYNIFFELIDDPQLSIIDMARLITTAHFLCYKTSQTPRNLCDLRVFNDKEKLESLIFSNESDAIKEFYRQCCYKVAEDAEYQRCIAKGNMISEFGVGRFFWQNTSKCKLAKKFGTQCSRFGKYLTLGSTDEIAWVCVNETVSRYNYYKNILNNVIEPIYDAIPSYTHTK